MFIGYFDETKWNITVVDQKSIVESDVNEHKLKLDIVFSSSDFVSIFEKILLLTTKEVIKLKGK